MKISIVDSLNVMAGWREERGISYGPRRSALLLAAFVVVVMLLAGCGVTTEVLVGTKVGDGGFYGSGPTATVRVRKDITPRTMCEVEHVSHLLAGRPFGPAHEEDSLNQVSCGFRFGGNR